MDKGLKNPLEEIKIQLISKGHFLTKIRDFNEDFYLGIDDYNRKESVEALFSKKDLSFRIGWSKSISLFKKGIIKIIDSSEDEEYIPINSHKLSGIKNKEVAIHAKEFKFVSKGVLGENIFAHYLLPNYYFSKEDIKSKISPLSSFSDLLDSPFIVIPTGKKEDYVKNLLGFDETSLENSSIFNLNGREFIAQVADQYFINLTKTGNIIFNEDGFFIQFLTKNKCEVYFPFKEDSFEGVKEVKVSFCFSKISIY